MFDGRGNDFNSVLVVAQIIEAYVSEEYCVTTETKQNKHTQLNRLIQTINLVMYTLSMTNNHTRCGCRWPCPATDCTNS